MKRYGIAAVMVMALLCSAHVSWATDPGPIWQTVMNNEAQMTSFTANWSRSTEVYNTALQQSKGTVTASGSMKLKKSGSVAGGLLRWLTTSTNSVNSNYNMYRPSNGKTYVAYPAISTVWYRDTAIGGLAADEVFGTSDLTYIGTDTIGGVTVKVIDAAYPAGAAATKARLWIYDSVGVVLKMERYNGTTLLSRYQANPSDITTTGSYHYVVASVTRYVNPAGTNEDAIHTDAFSSISINPSLADSAFDYSIPVGYTSIDQD